MENKSFAEDNVEARNFMVLNVGYCHVQHTWGYHDLSSPFIRIFYVVNGTATLHLPTNDVEMKTGHMYLVPSFVPHSYECSPGLEFYYLFVYERFRTKTDIFDEREFPIEVKANNAADLLFRNFCQLYPKLSLPSENASAFENHRSYSYYAQSYAEMESYEHLQLQGLVWIIFSYFMKHSQPKIEVTDERLMRAITYIQQHIDADINVDQIADISCMSKTQVARLFHQSFGMPPLQYVIRKKIQYAQQLLLTTPTPVNMIGKSVGFADPSYFIRLFKKYISLTPLDYRKKFK